MGLVIAVVAALLVVGPAMNMVVERVPDKLPLRGPRPDREPAPPVDLVVIGLQPWLARRGRGPGSARLPVRWLWCELLTAGLFALAWQEFHEPRLWLLWPVLIMFTALVPATIIDLQLLRLPDRVVFPAIGATAIAIVVASIAIDLPGAIAGAAVGAIAFFLTLFVPHLVYPKGMGFGDVKFALLLGLIVGWLGWQPDYWVLGPIRLVLYALIVGMLVGVLCGIFLPMIRRGRAFPLGPGLAVGAVFIALQAAELRF